MISDYHFAMNLPRALLFCFLNANRNKHAAREKIIYVNLVGILIGLHDNIPTQFPPKFVGISAHLDPDILPYVFEILPRVPGWIGSLKILQKIITAKKKMVIADSHCFLVSYASSLNCVVFHILKRKFSLNTS